MHSNVIFLIKSLFSHGWAAYTLLLSVGLAVGWEFYATHFEQQGIVQTKNVLWDASNNENLGVAIESISNLKESFILVLGNSQMATVKNGGTRNDSLAFELTRQLKETKYPLAAIDLSGPGQQVVESLLIFEKFSQKLRPQVVVLGVSLFSMRSIRARAAIRADFSNHNTQKLFPDLESSTTGTSYAKEAFNVNRPERKKTIQESVDKEISGYLGQIATFRNRQTIYNKLIYTPVCRDLPALFRRRVRMGTTARTYRIGQAYYPSVRMLKTMCQICLDNQTRLMLVVMPFDDTRNPTPFDSEDVKQLRQDLKSIAVNNSALVLDLSKALPQENFDYFQDGSPDGVHFDALGHTKVAREISNAILTDLRTPGEKSSKKSVAR